MYLWDWNNYISFGKDDAKRATMKSVSVHITCISLCMRFSYFLNIEDTLLLIMCSILYMVGISINLNQNTNVMECKRLPMFMDTLLIYTIKISKYTQ